jgi:hypothetical protein
MLAPNVTPSTVNVLKMPNHGRVQMIFFWLDVCTSTTLCPVVGRPTDPLIRRLIELPLWEQVWRDAQWQPPAEISTLIAY